MKNLIRFFVGISLLVLVVCYGCGVENSEAEMKAAQTAMDNAKNIFAEDLAASNWAEAMQAWEQGQAAVKEGKPAKVYFLRAKSRFEKTVSIAKATGAGLAKEIASMQITIGERFAKVKSALDRGRVPAKIMNQVKPIAAEVEEGTASVESLASQGSYVKATVLARDIQTKIYKAELLLAGKKPPQ
jgi:hypothetical protein